MVTAKRHESGLRMRDAAGFIERALLDFALLDQFESRPDAEKTECVRWVAEALNSTDEERRVTRVLDDLAAGRPLPRRVLGHPWPLPANSSSR